jgi:hypothetical protein
MIIKIKLLFLTLLFANFLNAQVVPFYSASNDKYGYKDAAGKVIIQPEYELAYPLEEGMAAVKKSGKYGYINEKGKEIIPPKYDNTWKFIGGYATVKLGGKYGFINKEGSEVVPPMYENAYNYHGSCCYKGRAHVKLNGKWKIITFEN